MAVNTASLGTDVYASFIPNQGCLLFIRTRFLSQTSHILFLVLQIQDRIRNPGGAISFSLIIYVEHIL